MYILLKRTNI